MNAGRRLLVTLSPILLVLIALTLCAGVLALAGQNPSSPEKQTRNRRAR